MAAASASIWVRRRRRLRFTRRPLHTHPVKLDPQGWTEVARATRACLEAALQIEQRRRRAPSSGSSLRARRRARHPPVRGPPLQRRPIVIPTGEGFRQRKEAARACQGIERGGLRWVAFDHRLSRYPPRHKAAGVIPEVPAHLRCDSLAPPPPKAHRSRPDVPSIHRPVACDATHERVRSKKPTSRPATRRSRCPGRSAEKRRLLRLPTARVPDRTFPRSGRQWLGPGLEPSDATPSYETGRPRDRS